MPRVFRIHGDNIVECERLLNIIINETQPHRCEKSLISPSTICVDLEFTYAENEYSWRVELLPGFNKAGRSRWEGNIFSALKENGSFLDETPDAIVTRVDGNQETILFALEFCSALQAGNQAWQRSGRAFSTGRTGCPYLYIVDFVKYELKSTTRERKSLRFPNPAVPYSYICFSRDIANFVAQAYIKAEEFDKTSEAKLVNFNEDNFAEKEIAMYVVMKMCGLDTTDVEQKVFDKNLEVVHFLADSLRSKRTNFNKNDWSALYNGNTDIVEYSISNQRFPFRKRIETESHHGNSNAVLNLAERLSSGLASKDLPFGIIRAENRTNFATGLKNLYPNFEDSIIEKIGNTEKDLIICMLKGFKPGGDDNRPDRGALPLVSMLTSVGMEVLTYIYGPLPNNHYNLLLSDPRRLATSNGLWKSFLSLSNYIVLDVPILNGTLTDVELLLDTTALKAEYTNLAPNPAELTKPLFSSVPQSYHEDDVDTGIHYLFTHVFKEHCFEGMCNPPGGDWSGLSVLYGNREVRWLSLPRESKAVEGKRPDHVLEVFGVFDNTVLLSIESKEKSVDLENDVGVQLTNYLRKLMDFVPNVYRTISPNVEDWRKAESIVNFDNFEVVSAAAYLKIAAQPHTTVFSNSNCELLFVMEPICQGWKIEIVANTDKARSVKQFLVNALSASGNRDISFV